MKKKDGNLVSEKKEEAEYRKKTIDTMMDIVEYVPGSIFPTSFTKRLKDIHNAYSYKEIYFAMLQCKDKLRYIHKNKTFETEYNKFNYLMAVLGNVINDIKVQKVSVKKEDDTSFIADMELNNIVSKPSSKRDLSDLLDI